MKSIFKPINDFWEGIKDSLSFELLKIGDMSLSLYSILYFSISLFLLYYLSGKLKRFLIDKVFPRYDMELGVRQALGTIIRYIILVLGLIIIVNSAGIDLSALTILAGALGVGIGFGLQNITNNFISGIIILFERPIKVGDRIAVGDINGDVVSISPRATTVVTNDNIAIIVPNSEFISGKVINWSYTDQAVRLNFPVGVAYKEDPATIKKLLMGVAAANPSVLKYPAPDVLFDEMADSALVFNLRVWTTEYTNRPNVLKSQLYYAIFACFKENNISIPYPQRDLHLVSGLDAFKK